MRRRVRAALAALALAALPATEALAFGFNVEPARVEVSVPAGARRGQTLRVRNRKSEAPIHLKVYVSDVIYLADGTHEFPPAGSTEWSCAKWIQVVPSELEIPPEAARDVRVSVAAPPDAAGGHYAIVFFETGPSFEGEGIGVNFRVGALVEAVVPKTERYEARLLKLAFDPATGIQAEVFNDGNLLIRPKGKIKVYDIGGRKVRELEFNASRLGILPKALRAISTKLVEPLSRGTYRVKAEIDYGARTLIIGELPAEVR